MADEEDALVSNTNTARCAGSIPALGTEAERVEKLSPLSLLSVFTIHAEKFTKSPRYRDDLILAEFR